MELNENAGVIVLVNGKSDETTWNKNESESCEALILLLGLHIKDNTIAGYCPVMKINKTCK